MILVYCSTVTPRKEYIFKHIFRRLMLEDFAFTTDLNAFVGHSGVKFSYGEKPVGDEYFIYSYGLLEEHGIDDHETEMIQWQHLPAFFPAPESSHLPFDIFSAAFYLLTRYEEYLPQVNDQLGRYDARESLAVKGKFLELPLVDLWVRQFRKDLNLYFDVKLSRKRDPQTTVCVEVSTFFKFRYRGVIENMSMLWNNLKRFRLKKVITQVAVFLRLRQDPYVNHDSILSELKNKWGGNRKPVGSPFNMSFFFHLGDYNRMDNGTSHRIRIYREAIKHIADYVDIGLRYSFYAERKQIAVEGKRFENIANRPLKKTMSAYSKIAMPGHYKRLVETEKIEDYSMGYETMPGFRASTCNPFYFYDLDYEVQTPLLVFPYALHYKSIEGHMLNGQRNVLQRLKQRVEEVSGHFIAMFEYGQFDKRLKSHVYTILEEIYEEKVQ